MDALQAHLQGINWLIYKTGWCEGLTSADTQSSSVSSEMQNVLPLHAVHKGTSNVRNLSVCLYSVLGQYTEDVMQASKAGIIT